MPQNCPILMFQDYSSMGFWFQNATWVTNSSDGHVPVRKDINMWKLHKFMKTAYIYRNLCKQLTSPNITYIYIWQQPKAPKNHLEISKFLKPMLMALQGRHETKTCCAMAEYMILKKNSIVIGQIHRCQAADKEGPLYSIKDCDFCLPLIYFSVRKHHWNTSECLVPEALLECCETHVQFPKGNGNTKWEH